MLLLASKSPRRKEILGLLDIPFIIVDSKEVEEVYPANLEPEKVPEFLSRLKAKAYLPELQNGDVLITADTVVILEKEIIGKPKGLDDAKIMLGKLSGKTHKVVTGVTLSTTREVKSFSSLTEVTFAPLTEEEINFYVTNFKPLDKAGAYGIQEWIGAVAVSEIKGSFYNVMGLPVHRLYKELMPLLI